jgi:uncharacterized protein (TIGR00299 family) protein
MPGRSFEVEIMKTMYLECFAGISGNMLLGALINAGVPEQVLLSELGKLSVSEEALIVKKVTRGGISAVYAAIRPHDHADCRLPDILALIDSSGLTEKVKEGSKQVFMKLAQAEAKVHGVSINDIHFDEAGAIFDIVGVVFGFNYLGVEKVAVSTVCVGSGFVECARGVMPVPTPTTAELLRGMPYYAGEISREMTTPTGAAILAVFATEFGAKPESFISEKIGYGAGMDELTIPNVLRLHIGYLKSSAEETMVVEANIDDLNPQLYPYTMDKLFAAGALDVWVQSVIMKKGRPGNVLSVLCDKAKLVVVIGIILAETSSIGVRYYKANRTVAKRKFVMVSTEYGQVNLKVCSYKGKVINVTPEYEDLRKLASQHNIPLKVVQQAVWTAANKLYAKE